MIHKYPQYPLIHRIPTRLRFSIPADATSVCSPNSDFLSKQNIQHKSLSKMFNCSCTANSCIPCHPSLSLRVTFCQNLQMLFSAVLSSGFNWVEILDNLLFTKYFYSESEGNVILMLPKIITHHLR